MSRGRFSFPLGLCFEIGGRGAQRIALSLSLYIFWRRPGATGHWVSAGGTDHRLSWSVIFRKITMAYGHGLGDRRRKAIVCPTLCFEVSAGAASGAHEAFGFVSSCSRLKTTMSLNTRVP